MFASLTGRLTASQIPMPLGPAYKAGVLTAPGFFPHRNWRTPLLANGAAGPDGFATRW